MSKFEVVEDKHGKYLFVDGIEVSGSYPKSEVRTIASFESDDQYVVHLTCQDVPMDAAGSFPYNWDVTTKTKKSHGCSLCGYPFGNYKDVHNYCPYCGAKVIS